MIFMLAERLFYGFNLIPPTLSAAASRFKARATADRINNSIRAIYG
jgi:hypothetical protein